MSLANERYDSSSAGWIFPVSVTEEDLPAVTISIGDPDAGGEMAFDILPRDISFSQASPG
jgi:hypothetical protein